MADRTPRNKNRLDLYRRLLPKIIESDQESGAQGYSFHWDDPDGAWDETDDPVWQSWDQIGLSPVIQELFHVIETMAGEDLEALENLDTYVDPLLCPEDVLGRIAASFGYALDEDQSEDLKRVAVHGLMEAYKSRGTAIAFRVFFRLLGFRVIDVFPLWKKDVHEEQSDYSRLRFTSTAVTEAVGPSGNTSYTGQISGGSVVPGSLRFTMGTVVVRDEVVVAPESVDDGRGSGDLIGPSGEAGTIRYATGEFTLTYPVVTTSAVDVTYERVDEEWPYRAARIDVEVSLSPGGGVPLPLLDEGAVDKILVRIDEVKPVHVVLRALAIVAEIADDVTPLATDQAACTTLRKNVLSGLDTPAILGLDHSYMLDGGTHGEDDLVIFQDFTVGTDKHTQVGEDLAPIVCPLDLLTITGPPGGPIYS